MSLVISSVSDAEAGAGVVYLTGWVDGVQRSIKIDLAETAADDLLALVASLAQVAGQHVRRADIARMHSRRGDFDAYARQRDGEQVF